MQGVSRSLSPQEARALLAWYREAGVDEAIAETPVDRFSAERPAQSALIGSGESAPAVAADPVLQARQRAAGAASLEELRNILDGFEACPLRYTAKNLVFADGNPQAPLMLVGEAPGAEEDLQGKPFVGRAGQLLDRMLAAIGIDRSSAYIANIVYWRPPGNRTPTPQETQICRPFIERQIELAAPQVLVLLGGAAAKELLGRSDGILRLRGKWLELEAGGRTIPVLPTLHPAYLLRQPAQKRLAWRDLLAVKKRLAELAEQAGSGQED